MVRVVERVRRAPLWPAEVDLVARPTRQQFTLAATVCVLSLSFAGVRAPAYAHPSVQLFGQVAGEAPPEAALALHRDGDLAYENNDFPRARDAWIGAYNALPRDALLVSYRATLLTLISDATLRAHEQDAAPEPLRAVILMYEDFLERILPSDSSRRAQLEEELRQVRARVPAAAVVKEPLTDPQPPTVPLSPASKPATTSTMIPDRGQRSSRAPVALLAAGSVVLVGGIAALVAGGLFKPRAEDQVSAFDDPVERKDAFVAAEAKKGALWMGGGGVLAATGLSLIIAGAVLHGRAKRRAGRQDTTRFAPWLEHPGVFVVGRF